MSELVHTSYVHVQIPSLTFTVRPCICYQPLDIHTVYSALLAEEVPCEKPDFLNTTVCTVHTVPLQHRPGNPQK
jgi:hypothetical protein